MPDLDDVVKLGRKERDYLTEKINLIEKKLFKIKFEPPELNEMFRYAVSGGRRARPVMTLVSCEAVGGDTTITLPVAIAIELGHKASLIRDDLVDGDEYRRGRKSLWAAYGRREAMVMADVLVSTAFKELEELDVKDDVALACRELIAATYHIMSIGQAKDILFEKKEAVTTDESMRMLYEKTAVLCEIPMKLGAMLGGGTETQIKALTEYGRCMGLAFQILNDVNNISGIEERAGRMKATDLAKGKKTSVTSNTNEPNEAGHTHSIKQAREKALNLMEEAGKSLQPLCDSQAKKILAKLTNPNILRVGAYFGLLEGEIQQ